VSSLFYNKTQIAVLVGEAKEDGKVARSRKKQVEIAKLPLFNREVS